MGQKNSRSTEDTRPKDYHAELLDNARNTSAQNKQRILFVGPIQQGKSSLQNTFYRTLAQKRIGMDPVQTGNFALAEKAAGRCTTDYRKRTWPTCPNLIFFDLPGFAYNTKAQVNFLKKVCSGIPSSIDQIPLDDDKLLQYDPGECPENKIDFAVFVLNAKTLRKPRWPWPFNWSTGAIPQEFTHYKDLFNLLTQLCGGVSPALVFTHKDESDLTLEELATAFPFFSDGNMWHVQNYLARDRYKNGYEIPYNLETEIAVLEIIDFFETQRRYTSYDVVHNDGDDDDDGEE